MDSCFSVGIVEDFFRYRLKIPDEGVSGLGIYGGCSGRNSVDGLTGCVPPYIAFMKGAGFLIRPVGRWIRRLSEGFGFLVDRRLKTFDGLLVCRIDEVFYSFR